MNTYEARSRMSEIGHRAIDIVGHLRSGETATYEERASLRAYAVESRGLLTEAGFPGEAVWRGLTRASMGIDTSLSSSDPLFWQDVLDDLDGGTTTLDDLISPHFNSGADFTIVG
jgi:hypothetical protein